VLVDGKPLRTLGFEHTAVVKGDAKCYAIACASIIAKVTRDRLMTALATRYPHFAWERNSGYGTPFHRNALAERGLTPHHRRSFCLDEQVSLVFDDVTSTAAAQALSDE
jgi:ribonuclease HII